MLVGFESMSQDEILVLLERVLTHPSYVSNSFTDMMWNLINRKERILNSSQLRAIEMHLYANKSIWI